MKTVVTGGGGFIGSHMAETLLNEGHKVIIIDRFSPGKRDNISHLRHEKNLTVIKRNICDDLSDIFRDANIDVIFHMAAMPKVQYSIAHPAETHHSNVNGTFNLLETARIYSVKRFVFSSSCAVYGDQQELPFKETFKPHPLSPYAAHKLIGEQYAALYYAIYGLETINLRYFNVFGPRQDHRGDYANLMAKFISLMKKGDQPTIWGDGTNTRDYIYVADVVRANILATTTKNRSCFGAIINIGSGCALSVHDVYKKLSSLHPQKIDPHHSPPVVEISHAVADIHKAKDLLGWEPTISFEKGLAETYNFFMNASDV